jgi:hypothetical protein
MTGFEPATSSTRTTRATKLRHIPLNINKLCGIEIRDFPKENLRIGIPIFAALELYSTKSYQLSGRQGPTMANQGQRGAFMSS